MVGEMYVGGLEVSQWRCKLRRTTNRHYHQQLRSSKDVFGLLIDKENEVDEREDSLDNTKQTSSEQRGVCASDTDRLEDGW